MRMITNRTSKTLMLVMIFMLMMINSVSAISIPVNPSDATKLKDVFEDASRRYNDGSDISDTAIKVRSARKKATGPEIILTRKDSEIVFDAEAFNNANKKDARNALTAFVNGLKDTDIPLDTQQDIMTQIQESDTDVASMILPLIFDSTKADLYTSYKVMSPFIPVLRFIFGVGTILIIMFLIATTILDLAYIGLPVWRETQADKNGGSKKPFGVSHQALSTVREAEKNLEEYKNAYLLYLKRRATVYIVLSICILYLVVGELGGLISWLLSLGSGVI